MKNILIVCADKLLRQELSKVVATKLKYLYVDIDEILDYQLLNNQNITLVEAGEALKQFEIKSINRALQFDGCVMTMSRNLFVSNENFKRFDGTIKAFLKLPKAHLLANAKTKDVNTLEQELLLFDKINNLISINCNITLECNTTDVNQIGDEIVKAISLTNI